MARWMGKLDSKDIIARNGRSLVELGLSYGIIQGSEVLKTVAVTIRYFTSVFEGLDEHEAWQLVRDTGVGDIPSLRVIGNNLLTDWNDFEPFRTMPGDYEFNPS